MMKSISTTYTRKDTISFMIDDDPEIAWLSNFDDSAFERFFVVMDMKVNIVWGNLIRKKLESHKKEIYFFEIEASENTKSISFYPKLVDFLESKRCNLSDLVIVVGGGIAIDLVSFTCSTYMRALRFYAVPTTLIGQIDASTAGKTCLNTANSKNLLGTFYYPLKVYSNIHFLETNSKYYLRQGYSEIFKYGLLISSALIKLMLSYFKKPSASMLMKIITLATNARIKVRKINPLASNLGHTFGHAIEKISDFRILHGDAISAGTVMSLYFSKKIGIIDEKSASSIVKNMKKIGLNVYIDKNLDTDMLVDIMMRDKKSSTTGINLVLIMGVAKPYRSNKSNFYRTSPDFVKIFLREFMKEYPYLVSNCASHIKKDKLKY